MLLLLCVRHYDIGPFVARQGTSQWKCKSLQLESCRASRALTFLAKRKTDVHFSEHDEDDNGNTVPFVSNKIRIGATRRCKTFLCEGTEPCLDLRI
jgi:hypothetical protein